MDERLCILICGGRLHRLRPSATRLLTYLRYVLMATKNALSSGAMAMMSVSYMCCVTMTKYGSYMSCCVMWYVSTTGGMS